MDVINGMSGKQLREWRKNNRRNWSEENSLLTLIAVSKSLAAEDKQLLSMIDRFRAVFSRKTRVVNIREYPFRGGCLGCFNCAVSGKCVYTDGFDSFLREKIQTAQAMVYAFRISDHSMGARFKMYDDRNFCNGHRTVTIGMPIGYLVDGPLSREENLKTVIEGLGIENYEIDVTKAGKEYFFEVSSEDNYSLLIGRRGETMESLSYLASLVANRQKGEYVKLGLREWTRSQQFARDPERSFCWVAKLPGLRRRHCRDARMLDNLRLEAYGTMDAPNIITAAWCGNVNSVPAKAYISVRPERYSYNLIKESGEFVINLPTEALAKAL